MHIPKFWAPANQAHRSRDGRQLALRAWGWSDADLNDARRMAESRLQNLLTRVMNGMPLPAASAYGYGERPLREEIIDNYPAPDGAPLACVTRNRYGSLVLNTAMLLFIDVDLPEGAAGAASKPGLLGGLFGKKPADPRAERREALRRALAQFAPVSFALYDTAAGFRALALSRTYRPDSDDVAGLMKAVGADPQFAALCKRQGSFRARLTPKPWRIKAALPPGDYPRDTAAAQHFARWLEDYQRRSTGFATCRYVDAVGDARPLPELAPLIALHDEMTKATAQLPLA
jgi:hypothetical protein